MKTKALASLALFSFLLLGCSGNGISDSTSEPPAPKTTISYEKLSGSESFEPSKGSSFEVVFFDIYNAVDSEGKKYENLCDSPIDANKPSDSYLIKSGDIEILVDGGFFGPKPNSCNSKTKYQVLEKSILPKIASYLSDDGVLDYLIVTHSDFDHLSMLSGFDHEGKTYGILDAFLKHREIKLFGSDSSSGKSQTKEFKSIGNIIDFDGYKTRCLCDEDRSNKLVDTETFRKYREKRDEIERNSDTYYSAASTFFEEVNCAQMDNDDDYENEDGQVFPSHLSEYVPTYYQEKKPQRP